MSQCFACLYVSEKDVLPLSLCLNEPWHSALTAARRQSGLKLEQLTAADGPARSQAPLGLEWKYHYHINHGCSRTDHSLSTKNTMAVGLCLRGTVLLLIDYCTLCKNYTIISSHCEDNLSSIEQKTYIVLL